MSKAKLLTLDSVHRLMLKAKEKGLVKTYHKFGTVKARQAKAGEVIDTIIDGVKETTNTAKSGDFVVTGPAGEEYIIDGKKFGARYEKVSDGVYKAIGSCSAFLWKGSPFSFESSWGERMICDKGDYLASVEKDLSQPYRIESSVFKKTYK